MIEVSGIALSLDALLPGAYDVQKREVAHALGVNHPYCNHVRLRAEVLMRAKRTKSISLPRLPARSVQNRNSACWRKPQKGCT